MTRVKDNAAYEVVHNHPLSHCGNVLVDQVICFNEPQTRLKYLELICRVVVRNKESQRETKFLTKYLRFGVTTVGWIYKDRWEIALFFKVLKQHLKVKISVGTSSNVLKTQIWAALIAVMLLKYHRFRSKCNLPLCCLVALLYLNLFSYRNLWDWLDGSFQTPPELPNP